MSHKPDFLIRLIHEQQELSERLDKLNDFIKTEIFVSLDVEDQDLLLKQANIMRDLGTVLMKRIQRLDK